MDTDSRRSGPTLGAVNVAELRAALDNLPPHCADLAIVLPSGNPDLGFSALREVQAATLWPNRQSVSTEPVAGMFGVPCVVLWPED